MSAFAHQPLLLISQLKYNKPTHTNFQTKKEQEMQILWCPVHHPIDPLQHITPQYHPSPHSPFSSTSQGPFESQPQSHAAKHRRSIPEPMPHPTQKASSTG
jgi:hypothetical protein